MNQDVMRRLSFDQLLQDIAKTLPTQELQEKFLSQGFANTVAQRNRRAALLQEAMDMLLKYSPLPRGVIHSVDSSIEYALKGGVLDAQKLVDLLDNLKTYRLASRFAHQKEDFFTEFPVLGDYYYPLEALPELEKHLDNIFDEQLEISDRASHELASIRRKIRTNQQRMDEKVQSLLKNAQMQKYLQEQIVTNRGSRLVFPVKSEYRKKVPGMIHDRSASGSTLYIEPLAMVQLNNDRRELELMEKEEIQRILRVASQMVAQNSAVILNNHRCMNEILLQVSLAQYHIDHKMNLAQIAPSIHLVQARHPSIPEDEIVPLNLTFGQQQRILIITGPNTGGKTVVLKTVGLFCLLHNYGLGVFAKEGSTLPFFDQVFVDIGDEQSIEQSLSTFSSHMITIRDILKECTKDSLVILDEVGAGTDPTEGAALARAILSRLQEIGSIVMASSHFSDVKEYALTHDGFLNASVEFDLERLTPTYHLLIGVPGNSNAIRIAKRLGMDQNIIDKSLSFMEENTKKLEGAIAQMQKTRLENEQMVKESKERLEQANQLSLNYEKKLKDLERQKEKIIENAKIEAAKLYREKEDQVKEILKQLRTMQSGSLDTKKMEELYQEFRSGKTESTNTKKQEVFNYPKKVKKGQIVFIPKFDQDATALEDSDRDGNFLAQTGILKMNVNVQEVQIQNKKKEEKKRYERMSTSFASDLSKKLDLRGMTKDEAMVEIETYLDRAFLSNINPVEIVHGKGSGVLRTFTHQLLKKHPHVKSYRLGAHGEGGDGVTIVTLRSS